MINAVDALSFSLSNPSLTSQSPFLNSVQCIVDLLTWLYRVQYCQIITKDTNTIRNKFKQQQQQ